MKAQATKPAKLKSGRRKRWAELEVLTELEQRKLFAQWDRKMWGTVTGVILFTDR